MPYEGTHSDEAQIKAIMNKRLKYWKKKAERDKKKKIPLELHK